MERVKNKSKKDKQQKHADKDNSSSFVTDVKSIKENLKIKEILRTVKMNNSMRIKAPRGSKVMNNKDFNYNDDFEDMLQAEPSPSATNRDVILNSQIEDTNKETKTDASDCAIVVGLEANKHKENEQENAQGSIKNETNRKMFRERDDIVESSTESNIEYDGNPLDAAVPPELKFPVDNPHIKYRERKLSLDQTMLTRRESLSQSELDLYSIGKSPLERKSSFFRKKMESFFKNTTEIFKRQSMSNKPESVQRRGSMSVSLQSLNEKSSDYNALMQNNQGSSRSLQSSSTVGRSTSSLSPSQAAIASEAGMSEVGMSDAGMSDAGISEADSLAGSQPLLSASQPLANVTTDSVQNLNEAYAQDSFLNSRAISMSSGLDSAHASRKRRSNSNRSNRVTWLASEGLAHYFRRLIQDENSKEMQVCHSYSDFTTIPENELYRPRVDAQGRRLSYQRAVSGEYPVACPPHYDHSLRRRGLNPQHEAGFELAQLLAEFTRHGVPPLTGFAIANIAEEAYAYLNWAEIPTNLEEFYDTKQLPPLEECRQAVVRELISTEAVHIKHLKAIVEVFIAAAHALQDAGKLLDIDTERLFMNIPDVLNASLIFWESAMYPMIADAVERIIPFNTELMASGFSRFRDIFAPYEKFVIEQTKALDYLRTLTQAGGEFAMYLAWCHSQKECNRLQLADILVKPMQRLTKYSLILRRIITYTDTEPERTSLIAMEKFAKNYVLDLNRTIRQREELEKLDILANSIESYEIDFKDEDLDRYFRMFSQLNLKAPMANCIPTHSRSVIFEGDLRYKDRDKEMEVRVFLLTDMMLITKKQKGSVYPFKLIRPKYFVDKLFHCCKQNPKNPKEIVGLIFVLVDEVSSSVSAFLLTDTQTNKDPNAQSQLKLWDTKVKEAKLTYEIAVWWAKNPSRDLTDVEMDSSSDYGYTFSGMNKSSEDLTIERDARERVAAMLHRMQMGASTECDFSQASMHTDSFDGHASGASGGRTSGLHNVRHPMHRTSTGGSSRQSRLSSFHYSTSAASHDEPQASTSGKYIYRTGSSVEHLIPPLNPEDKAVTSITVNVVGESESDATEPQPTPSQACTCQEPRSGGAGAGAGAGARSPGSSNTLRVHPQGGALAFVHSLPDLTVEHSPSRPNVRRFHRQDQLRRPESEVPVQGHITVRQEPQTGILALLDIIPRMGKFISMIRARLNNGSPNPQSASDKLYQSHQELLQRNRLSASQQHFLSPHHRGTSYPPPSPTRASLRRGLAFSYSLKNPPLSKMGHVNSQSQVQADHGGPSTNQQPRGGDRSAVTPPAPPPVTDKPEKKSKQFISRNKGGSKGSSGMAGKSSTSGTAGSMGPSVIAGKTGTNVTAGTSGTNAAAGTSAAAETSAPSLVAGTSGTRVIAGTNVIAGTSSTTVIAGASGTSMIPGTSGTSAAARTSGTSMVAESSGTSCTARLSGTSATAVTSSTSVIEGTSGMAVESGLDECGTGAANPAYPWGASSLEVSFDLASRPVAGISSSGDISGIAHTSSAAFADGSKKARVKSNLKSKSKIDSKSEAPATSEAADTTELASITGEAGMTGAAGTRSASSMLGKGLKDHSPVCKDDKVD